MGEPKKPTTGAAVAAAMGQLGAGKQAGMQAVLASNALMTIMQFYGGALHEALARAELAEREVDRLRAELAAKGEEG